MPQFSALKVPKEPLQGLMVWGSQPSQSVSFRQGYSMALARTYALRITGSIIGVMFKKYISYYKDNPQGYWFKRKVWGWGWVPVTWQGWLVIVMWLVAVGLLVANLDESAPPKEVVITFIVPIVVLVALLFGVCYKKGEKPRWQWGLGEEK